MWYLFELDKQKTKKQINNKNMSQFDNAQMGYDSYEEFMLLNPNMKDKIISKQYRSEYNSQYCNS